MERAEGIVEIARRKGHDIALMLCDLDRFKLVNDIHGHAAGDAVLAEIARRLRGALRGGDKVVRFGGEEFVLILPRADEARAVEIAERVRERVRATPIAVATPAVELTVTTSVGVAPLRPTSGTAIAEVMTQLLQRADEALAQAKDRGRDRVVVAP